jgi:hypothetical protein
MDSRQLLAQARQPATLEGVLRWAFGRSPPLALVGVTVQDEYTHDVVLRAGDVWLVFDTT